MYKIVIYNILRYFLIMTYRLQLEDFLAYLFHTQSGKSLKHIDYCFLDLIKLNRIFNNMII